MSYNYGNNAQSPQSVQDEEPFPFERRALLGLLITFILVSMLVLWAGRFPIRPTATPLTGTTYKTYVAADTQLLTSYGYTLEGKVHIPIDQAMNLIVERGLPVRTTTTSTP